MFANIKWNANVTFLNGDNYKIFAGTIQQLPGYPRAWFGVRRIRLRGSLTRDTRGARSFELSRITGGGGGGGGGYLFPDSRPKLSPISYFLLRKALNFFPSKTQGIRFAN
ncbi:hypothetical protein PUN28_009253 [Cardiocondyla obscurior]|uniref:Uncharacterized protein n=1 Tax=Cardiocondyla obscurior TaxID=286306 RepID=A0AAW2FR61_9HYME